MAVTVIPDIASLRDYLDHEFEPTDWIEISQERINQFAEATGDKQWIHVDVERAKRESPFGTTIAHGHLTLSLAPWLLGKIAQVEKVALMVNPGFENMRLRSPVPAGTKVRMHAALTNVRSLKGGAARATWRISFEAENQKRPVGHGNALVVYYPN